MNESQSEITPEKTWQKTKHANLVRNGSSGKYYARFRLKGKLLWRSLDTDKVTVAQIRLADRLKLERQKAASGIAIAQGRMTVGHAVTIYKQRLHGMPQLKAKTKFYHEQRIAAILKSWPGLEKQDLSKVTKNDCLDWAAKFGRDRAPVTFNHSLGILRQVLEIGVESGLRYDNPSNAIKRVTERTTKLRLPEPAQFEQFIKEIETSGSGFSKPCANLVRFLAYGGFRITEAKYITWRDCDFEKGVITVRGEPETGTKGAGDPRTVPMIQEMKTLLKKLREQHPLEAVESAVMQVHECQKAMDRAAKIVGMERITHHDLRHLFATRCIESGVDIPTVSRWLGHKDGGALAMRVYGHLRDHHSAAMAQKVSFSTPTNIVEMGCGNGVA
ncbi:MAG TPA: site-specific integrase [Verrucomicrobiae bacterium]|jgi:integrase|nr:site-specific integrase [Verrucomicrobiae bacterium]